MYALQGVMHKLWLMVFLLFLTDNVFALDSTAFHPKRNDKWKIIEFVDEDPSSKLVVIGVGAEDGLLDGAIINVYRDSHRRSLSQGNSEPIEVRTGKLKVKELKRNYAICEVLTEKTRLSKAFFPKFPGVMAGDKVSIPQVVISSVKVVLPEANLSYYGIFEDPKADPRSYELTEEGRKAVKESVEPFMGAHLSTLMVEGYTDRKGPSELNQIESLQRALSIKQYMIDELGFDANKVVAVGYGEDEPLDTSLVSGYEERNRRIVIKAIR